MQSDVQVRSGSIDTPFVNSVSSKAANSTEVRPQCPLGRLGTAQDVAQV